MQVDTARPWQYCAAFRLGLAALGAWWGVLSVAPACAAGAAQAASPQVELQFDIPAQSLATALLAFSRQAQVQIVTSSVELHALNSPGFHGPGGIRHALTVLLENSNLTFSFVGNDTVVIHSASRDKNAQQAIAADASPARGAVEGLEQIVVTARKRSESLQDTPVAVTALTAQTLALRQVDSIDQAAQFVPNVQFDGAAALSGASFNSTIFIRGIGQNDFATFSEPGVGVYVDGVYLGRSIGSNLLALDLARLEVLRGPQGSLFGRNTIGGAINIISQPPTEHRQMEAALTLGNLHRRDVKAILNLPFAEGAVLTRLSLAAINRDGYARQINYLTGETQERGDQHSLAGKLQALWHASEAVDATLRLDGTRTRQHAAPLTLVRITPPGDPYLSIFNSQVAPVLPTTSPAGTKGMTDAWITGDPYATYGDFGNFNDLDNWGMSLTIDARTPGFDLRSISAYRYLRAGFGRDGDNSPYIFRETFNYDTQSQVSQELQWSGLALSDRLHWLTGLYYFKENTLDDGGARLAVGVFDVTGIAEQDLDIRLYNVNLTESLALFAQGTCRLTQRLSMTPGVRFTHDYKRFTGHQYRFNARQYIVPPGTRRQATWSVLSPRLSLEFEANPHSLLYLSAANGYKSGGFNERPLRSIDEVNRYSPEEVWSYEAGTKTNWLQQRLIVNANVFYNDYEDMQLTVNATPLNFVANAAAGRIVGSEVELTARVAAGFDVNASAGYLDTRYARLRPCDTLSAAGAQRCLPITTASTFVKAPRWTLSLGTQYTLQSKLPGSLTLRGDLSYQSLTYHDVGNDPAIAQPGYALANAGMTFQHEGGRLELRAFMRNLFDERYRVSGNASSNQFGSLAESTFAPPREWSLTLSYKL